MKKKYLLRNSIVPARTIKGNVKGNVKANEIVRNKYMI